MRRQALQIREETCMHSVAGKNYVQISKSIRIRINYLLFLHSHKQAIGDEAVEAIFCLCYLRHLHITEQLSLWINHGY